MRKWITLGLLSFGLPLYGQQATARITGDRVRPQLGDHRRSGGNGHQRCDLSTKVRADLVFGRVFDSVSTHW